MFLHRFLTATILLILLTIAGYYQQLPLFVLGFCIFGFWEWQQLLNKIQNRILTAKNVFFIGMEVGFSLFLVAFYTLSWYGSIVGAYTLIGYSSIILALMFYALYQYNKHEKLIGISYQLLRPALIISSVGIAVFLFLQEKVAKVNSGSLVGAMLLLSSVLPIWIADTGAYIAGKLFGKNKLAPKVSPGKTWEGVMGGLFFVSIYVVISGIYWQDSYWFLVQQKFGIISMITFAWFITIASIIGDLYESILKRSAKVKDSGWILPGHGGVFDRIDGLIPTIPFLFCMRLFLI